MKLPPRIHAYRNLHRAVWSLRDPGSRLVVAHAVHVELVDVDFRVQAGGRAAVLRDGIRRVHAYVVGDLVARGKRRPKRKGRWIKFTYSPYREGTFVVADATNPLPIFHAARVRLDHDGAWCQRPRHTEEKA